MAVLESPARAASAPGTALKEWNSPIAEAAKPLRQLHTHGLYIALEGCAELLAFFFILTLTGRTVCIRFTWKPAREHVDADAVEVNNYLLDEAHEPHRLVGDLVTPWHLNAECPIGVDVSIGPKVHVRPEPVLHDLGRRVSIRGGKVTWDDNLKVEREDSSTAGLDPDGAVQLGPETGHGHGPLRMRTEHFLDHLRTSTYFRHDLAGRMPSEELEVTRCPSTGDPSTRTFPA